MVSERLPVQVGKWAELKCDGAGGDRWCWEGRQAVLGISTEWGPGLEPKICSREEERERKGQLVLGQRYPGMCSLLAQG